MRSVFPVTKEAQIIPALGLGFGGLGLTVTDTALPIAGAGLVVDSVAPMASSLDNGVFVFDTHECLGLELHGYGTGTAGLSGSARVFSGTTLVGVNTPSSANTTHANWVANVDPYAKVGTEFTANMSGTFPAGNVVQAIRGRSGR